MTALAMLTRHHMRCPFVLIVAFFCVPAGHLCLQTTAFARTWEVPTEVSTPQAGLDSASTGDTVQVAAGAYSVDIVFWPPRNGIVLLGAGFESTTIVGNGSLAVLYVANAVTIDTSSVVRGLTFRNGGDAGIILYGSSPLLDSCRVDSTRNGAAIHGIAQAAPIIRRCLVEHNARSGIRLEGAGSGTTVSRSVIRNNGNALPLLTRRDGIPGARRATYPNAFTAQASTDYGGGLYISGRASVLNNVLEGNTAYNGGGVWLWDAAPAYGLDFMDGNTIVGNRALQDGGGIYAGGRVTIQANLIQANIASRAGGVWHDDNARIVDNRIVGNTATGSGGGVVIDEDTGAPGALFEDNWIEGNSALEGGGIWGSPSLPITRNVVIRNHAYDGGGLWGGVAQDNVVAENTASHNGGGIYGGYALGNRIVRNMAGYDGAAIYLSSQVRRCTVMDNHSAHYRDAIYANGGTIDSCNILMNGFGLYNSDAFNVPDARLNWWGAANGPWHQGYNPAGQGDSLSVYAWRFSPWLNEPSIAAPPLTPEEAMIVGYGDDWLDLSWEAVPLGDLGGYRLYFDTDTIGAPYTNMVDVGNSLAHSLHGLTPGLTYHIALTTYDVAGNESWFSREITRGVGPVAVGGPSPRTQYSIQVYPNPFGDRTTVTYGVPRMGVPIAIEVFDLRGKRIRQHGDSGLDMGSHQWVWDGRDAEGSALAVGIYFVRIQAGSETASQRMILLR